MKLIFALAMLCSLLSAQMVPALGTGTVTAPSFTMTCTTTAPFQATYIHRMTLSVGVTLDWGDGQTTTLTANSISGIPHTYTNSGTYTIKVPQAAKIIGIDLRLPMLGGINTSQLRNSVITYFNVYNITSSTMLSSDMTAWRPTSFYLYSVTGTYVIASADMTAWRPTNWNLTSMPAGTYSIASADMTAWRPSYWAFFSMPAGTYSIASADMTAWQPSSGWSLYSMPAGTYSIASADMTAWRPADWRLHDMPAGTYSIASADMTAWTGVTYLWCYNMPSGAVSVAGSFGTLINLHSLQLYGNSLSQAQVNGVLQDLWTNKATFLYSGPILDISGNNAAPSGTYASVCAPTTGKQYAYDLVNGICTVAGPKWFVTFTP